MGEDNSFINPNDQLIMDDQELLNHLIVIEDHPLSDDKENLSTIRSVSTKEQLKKIDMYIMDNIQGMFYIITLMI